MIRKNCKQCGKFAWRHKSAIKKRGVFCSKKCANSGTRPWRRTGEKRYCKCCGGEFYVSKHLLDKEGWGLYCSMGCYKKGHDITKKCKLCNKIFTHKSYRKQDYCSRNCSNQTGEYRKTGIIRHCKKCSKKFYARKCEQEKKYCTTECFNNDHREIRLCKNCGKKFQLRKSDKPNICSIECWKKHAKIYPRTEFLRNKIRLRNNINNLGDRYIKGLINLPSKYIPPQLIELKRLNITRKRKLKEITHGNSQ